MEEIKPSSLFRSQNQIMQQCYQQALEEAESKSDQAVDGVERGFTHLFKHKKWLKDIPVVFVFHDLCEFKWETCGVMYVVMGFLDYHLLYEPLQKSGCWTARKEEFFGRLSQENVSQDLVWHLRLFL